MSKEFFSLSFYQIANVMRAKWLIVYAIFLFFAISGLLMFADDSSKAVASLLSLTLFIVPLISILYASIYWYNSRSFTHLLLTQPLRRSTVFLSHWLAIGVGLAGSYAVSTGAALLIHQNLDLQSLLVLFFGTALTFIFVGIGFLISVFITDRMKGIGTAFLIWFYFAILHDVLVFSVVSIFRDYPVEIPAILLMTSNPLDLARVHVLMALDLSTMMGYTGKILQSLLSGLRGQIYITLAQILWGLCPLWLGLRIFSRRDL